MPTLLNATTAQAPVGGATHATKDTMPAPFEMPGSAALIPVRTPDGHHRPSATAGSEPSLGVSGWSHLQLLPSPPSDEEKYSYLRQHAGTLAVSCLVGYLCLILSQVESVLADWRVLALSPFFVVTDIFFISSVVISGGGRDFDVERHRRLVTEWRPTKHPEVDILLPVCGEPMDVLGNTWAHVAKLIADYPGVARAYVLDDAPSDAVKMLAAAFAFSYGRRPDSGHLRKSGNLNFGLGCSRGEFILLLDADFVCRQDFLTETLPYFDAEPALGILQTPQFFRVESRQNWLERGAGAIQEIFYRAIQTSRQTMGAAICVGTCAVYRRRALEENGGFTQIDHSEDLHTGFDLNRMGWSLRYIP
ncbi:MULTISPECIES: glycosyltransferase, partial [unclassified Frankia]|uniref:glycosyltransferase n=1 Tax=unclassified Frankia TaxID=2632575 RepID=UPI002AD4CB71